VSYIAHAVLTVLFGYIFELYPENGAGLCLHWHRCMGQFFVAFCV